MRVWISPSLNSRNPRIDRDSGRGLRLPLSLPLKGGAGRGAIERIIAEREGRERHRALSGGRGLVDVGSLVAVIEWFKTRRCETIVQDGSGQLQMDKQAQGQNGVKAAFIGGLCGGVQAESA